MKILTKNLTGIALDWAVAKCEGKIFRSTSSFKQPVWIDSFGFILPKYSTDWAQGGPIGEREKITKHFRAGSGWCSVHPSQRRMEYTGGTELVSVMRCFVGTNFGDEIDVPEELLWPTT